jgi:hypothetical protein
VNVDPGVTKNGSEFGDFEERIVGVDFVLTRYKGRLPIPFGYAVGREQVYDLRGGL